MSERHIVAFSGGKDSSALALYLHDPERWRRALGKTGLPPRAPLTEAEYVFCDTGTELDETYEYLDRLEAYLGKPVRRLHAEAPPGETPFDHYLRLYGGFLPSAQMRWCTRKLKLEPYERYVGDAPVVSYVGIRGDEPDRVGYISTKPNIRSCLPFQGRRDRQGRCLSDPRREWGRRCPTITPGEAGRAATSASTSAVASGWDSWKTTPTSSSRRRLREA